MSWKHRLGIVVATACAVMSSTAWAVDDAAEKQSIDEVRNTVVNLLRAMVEKGLLTREQAELLVKQAQQKAQADATADAAKKAEVAKADEGAVRVPYVPQIVKDQISKQVEQEIEPQVVHDVVQEAKDEKWGVPAALPEWLSRVKVFGDVTIRAQGDLYPRDNSSDELLDYNAINQAGSIQNTQFPFINTTQDRNRLRLRARLGVEGDINDHLKAFIRLASGSLTDPGSESQTLGTYGQRYTVGIDQAYLVYNTGVGDHLSNLTVQGGRLANPWFAPTELVYARDLTFEGVTTTGRFGWGAGGADRSHVYATIGAFPMLEVPLVNQENKWMVGAQVGTNLRFGEDGGQHVRLGISYYDFLHVTGKLNDIDSIALNYTAPTFLRYGNTVFDISDQPGANVNLFGLAAHFRLVDIAANYDVRVLSRYSIALTGEAVRNIGYNMTSIEAENGQTYANNEDTGYVGEFSFGHPIVDAFGKWRAAVGYRYVQRDAVLDAWTDADFHEGGTNARGYYVWTSVGVAKNTWVRLRYMSANEVDGPRYGLDIWQLDVNARF